MRGKVATVQTSNGGREGFVAVFVKSGRVCDWSHVVAPILHTFQP